MKRILPLLMIPALWLTSCSKEPQPLTRQQIQQKIDSATTDGMKQADERAKIDLQHRIKIEVKAKVDSIVTAMKDTTVKAAPAATLPVPVPQTNR